MATKLSVDNSLVPYPLFVSRVQIPSEAVLRDLWEIGAQASRDLRREQQLHRAECCRSVLRRPVLRF